MFWFFGVLLFILGCVGLLAVSIIKAFFGKFFERAEKAVGAQGIFEVVFDYLLGNAYLYIGLFLFLPAIVFFIIGYFY